MVLLVVRAFYLQLRVAQVRVAHGDVLGVSLILLSNLLLDHGVFDLVVRIVRIARQREVPHESTRQIGGNLTLIILPAAVALKHLVKRSCIALPVLQYLRRRLILLSEVLKRLGLRRRYRIELLLVLRGESRLLDGLRLQTVVVVLRAHCSLHPIEALLERWRDRGSVKLIGCVGTIAFELPRLCLICRLERTRVDLDRFEPGWHAILLLEARGSDHEIHRDLAPSQATVHLLFTFILSGRLGGHKEVTHLPRISSAISIHAEELFSRQQIFLEARRVSELLLPAIQRRISLGGQWT